MGVIKEVIRKEISWGSAFKDIDTPEAYSGNQNRDPTEDPFSGKILSKGHSPTWKLLVWGEVSGSKVVFRPYKTREHCCGKETTHVGRTWRKL